MLCLQRLMLELMKKLDAELKHEVCHWAAFYVSALSYQQSPLATGETNRPICFDDKMQGILRPRPAFQDDVLCFTLGRAAGKLVSAEMVLDRARQRDLILIRHGKCLKTAVSTVIWRF